MSRQSELAELSRVYDSSALSNRNLVINGAMTVSQRGTSEASVTSSQYADAPDRFKVEMNTAGTWTVSQSTTAPAGFSNSYKFDCTTADGSLGAGDYIHLSHYFEGQNLQHLQKGSSAAQKVTLSFYVRSAKTGTYIVEFFDQDNNRSISKSYTIDAANTWEKKTITIDGDTSGALGNDNGASFGIFFFLAAGSNFSSGTLNTSWGSRTIANIAVGQVNLADSTSNDWYITGVQLEVGDTATPFEHRSFGQELALCQRYFQTLGGATTNDVIASGFTSTANFFGYGHLNNTMRAAPTASVSGTNSDIGYTHVAVAAAANSAAGFTTNLNSFFINIPSGTTTTSNAGSYARSTSTSTKLHFDAEL
jgi:hypothetical protein